LFIAAVVTGIYDDHNNLVQAIERLRGENKRIVAESSRALDSTRPLFTTQKAFIDVIKNDRGGVSGYALTVVLVNSRINPARNPHVRLIAVDYLLGKQPPVIDIEIDSAADIGKDGIYNIVQSVHLQPDSNPWYVFLGVSYDDAVTGKPYRQPLYFRWNGSRGGEAYQSLLLVSKDERGRVTQYLRTRGIQSSD
jgi:hypothetical protein